MISFTIEILYILISDKVKCSEGTYWLYCVCYFKGHYLLKGRGEVQVITAGKQYST